MITDYLSERGKKLFLKAAEEVDVDLVSRLMAAIGAESSHDKVTKDIHSILSIACQIGETARNSRGAACAGPLLVEVDLALGTWSLSMDIHRDLV